MNRKYYTEAYIALAEKIRERIPGIAITTDIIVGFPGETDVDFGDTLSLVKGSGSIPHSLSFILRAAEPKQRKCRIRLMRRYGRSVSWNWWHLQNKNYGRAQSGVRGKTTQVLVEGISTRNPGHVCGRTSTSRW